MEKLVTKHVGAGAIVTSVLLLAVGLAPAAAAGSATQADETVGPFGPYCLDDVEQVPHEVCIKASAEVSEDGFDLVVHHDSPVCEEECVLEEAGLSDEVAVGMTTSQACVGLCIFEELGPDDDDDDNDKRPCRPHCMEIN